LVLVINLAYMDMALNKNMDDELLN